MINKSKAKEKLEAVMFDFKIHYKDIQACFNDSMAKNLIEELISEIYNSIAEEINCEGGNGTDAFEEGQDSILAINKELKEKLLK